MKEMCWMCCVVEGVEGVEDGASMGIEYGKGKIAEMYCKWVS
jgi:hypothetical protein